MSRVNLFTIPAGVPFADELARGINQRFGSTENPLVISEAWVLVPTRRAIRTLREAFERVSPNGIAVLPKIVALGDFDEEPSTDVFEDQTGPVLDRILASELAPVIHPLRREFLLMTLVQRWSKEKAKESPEHNIGAERPALALKLAKELAGLFDLAASEGLSWKKLQQLVPQELAEHWTQTLQFLEILAEHWPRILATENVSDPAIHRDHALRRAAETWRESPPHHPIIAAGSTGSVPATAALLKTIASLPQGAVVLPGLDGVLDEHSWSILSSGHPQHGMAQLLAHLDVKRSDVRVWTKDSVRPERVRLIAEAMRPAETTTQWQSYVRDRKSQIRQAIEGCKTLVARTQAEEALAIACALRESVESQGKTATLVTPNRTLARRVASELKRWNIAIDDSAGTPLGHTEIGRFLCLISDVVAEEFAPVPLLALLKHPLCALSFENRSEARSLTLQLEHKILRGARPLAGIEGLRQKAEPQAAYFPIVAKLEQALGALAQAGANSETALTEYLQHHRSAAELVCDELSSSSIRVWEGEAGEAAFRLFESAISAAEELDLRMSGADYASFIREMMTSISVRPRAPLHPRVSILGPLEARLQQADFVILGGLNEGKWPPATDPGPWLNRPMRKELEVSQPERRIGLSAHDFAQAAAAPEVLLTRAEKEDGAPTTPCRWLTRLNTLVKGAGLSDALVDTRLVEIARRLDQPSQLPKAVDAPAPKPPVHARPRTLPVTDVERWVRDPYALYAKRVLGLARLDELDQSPSAADRGTIIHKSLERFVRKYPKLLPSGETALCELLSIGKQEFKGLLEHPSVQSIWWPRFERAARWYLNWEESRRENVERILAEVKGQLTFEAPLGPFTLTAKADRIEIKAGRSIVIADYKTGGHPTGKQVQQGFSPQLTLEGAIALAHGFPGVEAATVDELIFVSLKGDAEGGKEKVVSFKPLSTQLAILDAVSKFKEFVARFDSPDMPYLSRPHVLFQSEQGDYDHLARVKEWSSGGDQ